jgi:hypothetical protein
MAKAVAKVEIEIPDDGRDMFVVVDGVKIAMRGRPGTPQSKTWISLEPRWSVLDCREGGARAIEVSYEGVRVH